MTGQECAKCQQPSVTVHLLSLDQGRRIWLLCCLCMASLIAELDHAVETSAL